MSKTMPFICISNKSVGFEANFVLIILFALPLESKVRFEYVFNSTEVAASFLPNLKSFKWFPKIVFVVFTSTIISAPRSLAGPPEK